MNVNPVVLSIPIYFLLILIELVIDRWKNLKLYRLNDAITNISCGITEQVSGLFAKVFTIGLYHLVYTHFKLFDIPTNWYFMLLLYLGVDFFYYWGHRMSHEVNLFWTGHVIHHQSEDYNLSVALRQGAFQKVFTAAFYLPLALVGFDTESFLYINALNTIYQFWIHTETIGKMGWFEYVFNTPSHHRVHHGRNPKYIDKNHAGSLIIWDKLFGTFQAEEERAVYGITVPANTWNPINAHIKPFQDLYKDVKSVPNFTDKLKLLFMPPGWFPESVGGRKFAPEIKAEEYTKFNNPIPIGLSVYVLVQYIVLLAFTAYFLFEINSFDFELKLMNAAFILFSVFSIGLLLEQNKVSYVVEILRLVLFVLIIFI
jgi:alkylglycerol monooxygenase